MQPGLRPEWGRLYGEVGPLIAGIPTEGPDRGTVQGLHAGLGADIFSGRVMWNINGRIVWLQRHSGENVFAVQIGARRSHKLGNPVTH